MDETLIKLKLHSIKVCASGVEDNEEGLLTIQGLGDFEYEKDLMSNIVNRKKELAVAIKEAEEIGITVPAKYKEML